MGGSGRRAWDERKPFCFANTRTAIKQFTVADATQSHFDRTPIPNDRAAHCGALVRRRRPYSITSSSCVPSTST